MTTSVPAGGWPTGSGCLCSASYRASVAADGCPLLAMIDIDRPADGAAHPFGRVGGGEALHALAFGQQVGHEHDRALHRRRAPSATPCTSSVGIKLVKKLPGPITTASNLAMAPRTPG